MYGSALSAELFEGVPNFAELSIKLFLRQFNRFWSYDALCQIRHFGLHVEGCIHHFRSLPMCGLLPYPELIRLSLTVLSLQPLPAHPPATPLNPLPNFALRYRFPCTGRGGAMHLTRKDGEAG